MYNKAFNRSSKYAGGGAGAREGLKQKMDYWSSKDFDTEYSIAVSQALNLAYQRFGDKRDPTQDEVFTIFQQILNAKLDDKFQDFFKNYYDAKINLKASQYEKAERALDEAMRDAAPGQTDFGDDMKPSLDGGLLVN